MEPIISPWIFYWMDVVDNIALIVKVVGTISLFAFVPACSVSIDGDTSEEIRKKASVYAKKSLVLLVSCILLFGATPSKDTMYKMLITSYITPNNIELVGGSIDTALDKFTDKVVKIKEAK